jgi:Helix-turn-helix domain
MPKPPVPVVFLYDPEEFWEHIRQLIREELAKAADRQAIYSTADLCRLFQIQPATVDDWAGRGILKPVKIRGQVYFLHSDLEHLFRTPPEE